MTIDVLPTVAHLIGAKLPDHPIDGKNIWPLLAGEPDAKSPHEALFFYWGRQLQAVRMGKWKLHFPHDYRTLGDTPPGKGGRPCKYKQAHIGLSLFDLEKDIGEKTDVSAQHPDVVARIQKLADAAREELGEGKRQGKGCREAERLQKGDLRFNWKPGTPNKTEPEVVP